MSSLDSIDRSISWHDALNIHNAIHQKKNGVSVEVEGIKYPIGKAKNGCWTCVVKGISCMEQNPKKKSKFGQMALNGARLTWYLSTPRWGLIRDGQYEQKCWFVREAVRGKSGVSPAKRKLSARQTSNISSSSNSSHINKSKNNDDSDHSNDSDSDGSDEKKKTKKKSAAQPATKKRRIKSESDHSHTDSDDSDDDDDDDDDDKKKNKKKMKSKPSSSSSSSRRKVKVESSDGSDNDNDSKSVKNDKSDRKLSKASPKMADKRSAQSFRKKAKSSSSPPASSSSAGAAAGAASLPVKNEPAAAAAAAASGGSSMSMLADDLEGLNADQLERIERQAAAVLRKRAHLAAASSSSAAAAAAAIVTSAPLAAGMIPMGARASSSSSSHIKQEGVHHNNDGATVAYPDDGVAAAADMSTIGYQGNIPSTHSRSNSNSGGSIVAGNNNGNNGNGNDRSNSNGSLPPLDYPTVAFPTMSAVKDALPAIGTPINSHSNNNNGNVNNGAMAPPSPHHPLAPMRRRVSNEPLSPPNVAVSKPLINAANNVSSPSSSLPPSSPHGMVRPLIPPPPQGPTPRAVAMPPPAAAAAAAGVAAPLAKRKKRKPVAADTVAARKKHIAQWLIPYADLTMEIRLGSGAFGEVRRAIWQHTVVAVKVLHKGDDKAMGMFLKEAVLLCKMHHPCIVRTFGVTEDPPCIVMEFLPQDLWAYIKQHGALAMDALLPIAIDIAKGISYLHHQSPQIIHRDLKPANILLDTHRHAKVADFGISFENHDTTQMTACGTPHYMAPELVSGTKYTSAVDVYAFGMILWVMLTAKIPFQGLRPLQVMMKVVSDNYRPPLPRDTAPAAICDLIDTCWRPDPALRPSMDDVIISLQQLLTPNNNGNAAIPEMAAVPLENKVAALPMLASPLAAVPVARAVPIVPPIIVANDDGIAAAAVAAVALVPHRAASTIAMQRDIDDATAILHDNHANAAPLPPASAAASSSLQSSLPQSAHVASNDENESSALTRASPVHESSSHRSSAAAAAAAVVASSSLLESVA